MVRGAVEESSSASGGVRKQREQRKEAIGKIHPSRACPQSPISFSQDSPASSYHPVLSNQYGPIRVQLSQSNHFTYEHSTSYPNHNNAQLGPHLNQALGECLSFQRDLLTLAIGVQSWDGNWASHGSSLDIQSPRLHLTQFTKNCILTISARGLSAQSFEENSSRQFQTIWRKLNMGQ